MTSTFTREWMDEIENMHKTRSDRVHVYSPVQHFMAWPDRLARCSPT